MAYGYNRSGNQPRAMFIQAGGMTLKYKNPILAGHLSNSSIDEIDISSFAKLDSTFFETSSFMDNSKMEVLVDGSVQTIVNKCIAGSFTLRLVEGSGLVSDGDPIACFRFVKSVGDIVGGTLSATRYINGRAFTTLFYGVTLRSLNDFQFMGNDIPEYSVDFNYAGYIQAMSDSTDNKVNTWAVGNANGISAYYKPYSVQNSDGTSGTKGERLGVETNAHTSETDSTASDFDNSSNATTATDASGSFSDIISDGTVNS